ncbi:hypothetical protein M514_10076 [Trichuris suis]|uniref:XRN2-binding (XTBD) domain-containing protein n=1 Tax=Trichuris suis TaxID=68888 RepID=A0A085MU29_9BILA|nr:hypothetical protein M514_10076 [Trichuris suis]
MDTGDINLNEYRQPWETDHAWNIRSRFLRRNWGKVSKERLFCLSNVFVNMEQYSCCYPDSVMDEVREMAGDLVEAYHDPIKALAQKILPRRQQREDTSHVPRKMIRTESCTESRRGDHGASSSERWHEAEDIDEKRMKDLFCRLRAQLSVAAKEDNPIRRLNELCNLIKCVWRTELSNNECTLLVDEVILLTQLHWGDPLQAKMNACDTACEILQRPSHRLVRVRGRMIGSAKFQLYSGTEDKAMHQEPSAWRLSGLTRSLTALSKRFESMSVSSWRSKPRATLAEACKELCLPIEINRKRLVGWCEQYTMILGGVIICDMEVRAVPKNKPHAHPEDELCLKTIDSLLEFGQEYELKEVVNGVVHMMKVSRRP